MESTSPINDLPPEILGEIFTLYYHSKIFSPRILKLVCRRWCNLVDHMPIMRSDIVLAPNLFCNCNRRVSWEAIRVPCMTVSQLNKVLSGLGQLEFKLTVLGCMTCFRKADVYDTDLDQNSIDLRCRSLQIFCPINLATPLIESIKDAPSLESFETYSTGLSGGPEKHLMHIAINQILRRQPRLLRKLGVVYVEEFELDNSKRQVLECIEDCHIYDDGLSSGKKLLDLASNLENVSTLKLISQSSTPLKVHFPRLRHLYFYSIYIQRIPDSVYSQLTTLKLMGVQMYPHVANQYEMPNLRRLYLMYCRLWLRWFITPNLDYLYINRSDRHATIFAPKSLVGSELDVCSMRPRTIGTLAHFDDNTEKVFGKLWECVEDVEIHVGDFGGEPEKAAKMISAEVRAGKETLSELRHISIILKGNTVQDIESGNTTLGKLKAIIKMPLLFSGSYPVQVRHRWANLWQDPCASQDWEMKEGSAWSIWEA